MNPGNHKHIPPVSDLEYLAQAGYEKIPPQESDLQELYQRIDQRVAAKKSGTFKPKLLLALALISFATLVWYYTYYVPRKNSPASVTATAQPLQPVTEQSGLVGQATLPLSETSVAVKAEETRVVYPREHFTKENTSVHFQQDIQAEAMPVKTLTNIEEQPGPTPKEKLELLPNAPVIYICDLKVSDYQRLYFKKSEPFMIKNGGLSALYENGTTYSTPKTREEPVYTADMALKDGLQAFGKQDYSKAQSCFLVLLELNRKDVNAQFYSALCAYHLNNTQKSEEGLRQVLLNENNVFDQEAEWYLALTLLKNNELESVRELLLKINRNEGFYADKAGMKLSELK